MLGEIKLNILEVLLNGIFSKVMQKFIDILSQEKRGIEALGLNAFEVIPVLIKFLSFGISGSNLNGVF